MIAGAGGAAVPVRVDHTVEAEVEALAARIRAEDGRLDVLVNDVWGGDALIDWGAKFWTLDMVKARALADQAILSHLITARHMAPMMVEAGRGLIVEVTDGELSGYRGQLLYDLVKASVNRLAYAMAWDLVGTGVSAVAVSPGFLRSEAVLDQLGVTEANWRDGRRPTPASPSPRRPVMSAGRSPPWPPTRRWDASRAWRWWSTPWRTNTASPTSTARPRASGAISRPGWTVSRLAAGRCPPRLAGWPAPATA